MPVKSLLSILLLCFSTALSGQVLYADEDKPKIGSLGFIDRTFLQGQRERIDTLARDHLGRQLQGNKSNDLDILQTLLDRRLVGAEQTLELQAMGVVMGDLLAADLNMSWVIYEDKVGRSRALRLGLSDHYLFPVTMISRRAEVGAAVDTAAIYAKAAALMEPYLPPKPFQ